jgi:hypothetical protein
LAIETRLPRFAAGKRPAACDNRTFHLRKTKSHSRPAYSLVKVSREYLPATAGIGAVATLSQEEFEMIRTIAVAFFVLAQIPMGAAATCAGVDLAITSVSVKDVTKNGLLNQYHIAGTVANLGGTSQASSMLQFVNIYQYGRKLDAKSVPPLRSGQSYTFSYALARSADAGSGTTTLDFHILMRPPIPAGQEECNVHNDQATLRF